jgi:hypothetical protein
MTRAIFTILAILAATFNTAFAAPKCTSYQGLMDADGDGACVFVGTATAITSGWTGVVDCDDAKSYKNPGATEIVGDGIDQDCDGKDLTLPVSDAAFARYVAVEYKGKAPSANLFITEYDRCVAATGRCSADNDEGRFMIADPEVDAFVDIYKGESKVLRADGIREVVTLEEQSHFSPGGAKPASSYTGPSKATRVAEAKAVAEPLVAKEREDRLAEEAREDAEDDARDGEINDINDRARSLAYDLEVEATARREADLELVEKISDATDIAEQARTTAARAETSAGNANVKLNEALSHSPLIEAGPVGGANFRLGLAGLHDGEWLRGPVLGLGGFGLRAGVDGDWYEVAGFGQILFGGDGAGTGADIAFLAGVEGLGQLDMVGTHLGGFLAYTQSEDHGNVLDVSVVERGAVMGVVLNRDFAPGPFRTTVFVRAGAGPTCIGFRGHQDGQSMVASSVGVVGLIQAGINLGVGAKL